VSADGLADLRKTTLSQVLWHGGEVGTNLIKTSEGLRVRLSVRSNGEKQPVVVVLEEYETIQLATELLMFQSAAQWKGILS